MNQVEKSNSSEQGFGRIPGMCFVCDRVRGTREGKNPTLVKELEELKAKLLVELNKVFG